MERNFDSEKIVHNHSVEQRELFLQPYLNWRSRLLNLISVHKGKSVTETLSLFSNSLRREGELKLRCSKVLGVASNNYDI
jgi:hypothetical protein